GSVPPRRATSYCSGVRRRRHSSSVSSTRSGLSLICRLLSRRGRPPAAPGDVGAPIIHRGGPGVYGSASTHGHSARKSFLRPVPKLPQQITNLLQQHLLLGRGRGRLRLFLGLGFSFQRGAGLV